jgi:hypothetical protein
VYAYAISNAKRLRVLVVVVPREMVFLGVRVGASEDERTSFMSQSSTSPVPAPSYALRVFRIAAGTAWTVRTNSKGYSGLVTHYGPNGSVWCPGTGCLSTLHRKGPIWKGYCTVDLYDPANRWWAPVVLEITETCELDMRGRYERGQLWELSREADTPKRKSPVRAKLIGQADETEMGPPIDCVPVLRSLYHAYELTLGTPNPMPARVMVSPIAGTAPPTVEPVPEGESVAAKTFRELEEERRRRLRGAS